MGSRLRTVALFGLTMALTLFTAGFLLGGGPEYWKFGLFSVSLILFILASFALLAPGAFRIPSFRRAPADPGPRVTVAQITSYILETKIVLLSELPMVKVGGASSKGSGSVS